jgi:hypothetical protein
MSSLIQIKNTATSGSAPTSLAQGEIAINVTDGKLFYGSGSNNVVKEFSGGGGGGGTINTGSLLTTASFNAYTGSNTSQFAGTASFASNGGVTSLIAGSGIILSPTNGKGNVTINSTGGSSFNTATGSYGSFYDTTTQTNPVADVPRSMSLNTTDISNGVSISGSTNPFNTYIKMQNAGVYDIQFSAQVDKTDGGSDDVVIWLRKNGIDLTDTATTLTLPTNNSKVVAAWNWFVNSSANDYYQIIWRSLDTDLRLLAEVSSSTHPGIPSLIVTANRVDQFLSNTGSFSGSFTGQFTGSLFGTSSWATNASTASFITGSTNAFIQGGNSFGATALLGTNDDQSLALETSGSTRMFISSSGNVGIGTTSSLARVTINHDASLINPLELVNTYSGTGFFSNIVWKNSTNLVRGNFGVNNQSGEFRWDVSSGGYFPTIYSNGAEIIRINTSGNTGIKTTTPAATLDVSGSVNISGSGNQVPLRVYSGSTPLLYVSQSGQVGIGTSTPAYNLEVVGSSTTTARFFGNSGTAVVGIGANGTLSSTGGQFRVYANTSVPLALGSYNTYGDLWIINGNTGIGYGTTAPTLTSRFSIRGSGATSATTNLIIQNSTPTNLLSINDIGQVSFTSPTMSLAASQSAFSISPIISASAVIGGQYYGVNITPTFYQTTGSQTETAFRVVPTFTSSNATATSGSNIIADFGSTSAGSQLTVTDVTSGSIYMVNDVSGLPILEATSDWGFKIYDYPKVILQKSGSNIAISGSFAINNNNAAPVTENTLTLGTPLAGGAGEGGQLGLQAAGGSYTSASFLDTWQDQFRILRGPNNASNAGLMYMNLQSGNTQFVGAITASAFSGLPNDYLYAVRSGSNQTVGSNWVSQDIIFNSTVVSKGITYNTGSGVASLTGGKVYRVTARLAWAAASAYNLQYSCYTSANTQIGPTVEMIQSTNSTNNISDGTLEFIYAPVSNTDIKIRTTANNTALSGEQIRYDLNTQFIIQQIA